MSINKFDFEDRTLFTKSAVKTEKYQLSITLTYNVDQERRAQKL